MNKFVSLLGIIALVVLLVAIGPLVTIWALNTLFPSLAIAYTLETWVAVVLLGAFLRANVSIKKDKD
jgi:ribosomal protein RSM22 (predicted rRNA methylase)